MKRPSLPKISMPQIRHRKEMHAAQLAEREQARQNMLTSLRNQLEQAKSETDPAVRIKAVESFNEDVNIIIKYINGEAYLKRRKSEKKGALAGLAVTAAGGAALIAGATTFGLAPLAGLGLMFAGDYIGEKNRKKMLAENEAYMKELRTLGQDGLQQVLEEVDLNALKVSNDFTDILKTYPRLQERFAEAAKKESQPRKIEKPRTKPVDPKIEI
jgi:hypothetical protein